MDEKMMVTKIAHFVSKKTTPETHYYVIEGVLKKNEETQTSFGHEYLKVFTTAEKYQLVSQRFTGKFDCEIDIHGRYENGQTKFEIA